MGTEENIIKKDIPILYTNKSECCGCSACLAACLRSQGEGAKAIVMVQDECGFLYPKINETYCVRCYCCIVVCPMK